VSYQVINFFLNKEKFHNPGKYITVCILVVLSYITKPEVTMTHAYSYDEYRILAGKYLGKRPLGNIEKEVERSILERPT
jgi:hypothetical protein